ncbi:MAG: hypothetical protein ABIL01_30560 [Pseudomonadota bacterium]
MPISSRKIFTFIAAAAIVAIVPLDFAAACSCARPPTAQKIYDYSVAVFTGIARSNVAAERGSSITTFEVIESFKGMAAKATVQVHHRSGLSASCGVKFTPGATYTLSVRRSSNATGLTTSLCQNWMFRRGEMSEKLITELRAMSQPAQGSPPQTVSPTTRETRDKLHSIE